MSLSNSLPHLEQAFRELQQNIEKSIGELQIAVQGVIETALSDDKTPLQSALALRQALEAAAGNTESFFDIVIFGDLNRFKGLNDRFGHSAGDFAIQFVGTMIQNLLVEQCQAQAFRQSGDEFVILLKQQFLEQFQKLSAEFGDCKFEFEEQQIKTAMSFGYAARETETDFEILLARAEIACQEAKRAGDGVSVEWTVNLESSAFVNRRGRCPQCQTEINCNIPGQNQLLDLKVCPVCESPLIILG